MARYKVILVYDGTGFHGSQRQIRARTVQAELENALRKLGWVGRSVMLAGRTDSGVHATGQVAAFDFVWVHSDEELLRALNAELPADLAVSDLCTAAAAFHPRFDAAAREYHYRLFCGPIRDPLRERFAWRIWPEVSLQDLRDTAGTLTGTHDYSAFGSPVGPTGTTIRTVTRAEWRETAEGLWQFEVRADAFLYRMVRRLVFVQILAARGKCLVEDIQKALTGKTKLPAGLAPAHGLTLVEVSYGS